MKHRCRLENKKRGKLLRDSATHYKIYRPKKQLEVKALQVGLRSASSEHCSGARVLQRVSSGDGSESPETAHSSAAGSGGERCVAPYTGER